MVVPSSKATSVLKELNISDLRGVELTDIFSLKGIFYNEKPIKGHLARIVSSAHHSIITLDSAITYRNQKRFIQAHELGHFELHRSSAIIYDDETAFNEYHANGGQEVEANEFAAELLMPRLVFKQIVESRDFSMDVIRDVSEYFETSITSTIIRYVEFGSEPIAMVFSQGGTIRWTRISKKFPLQFIRRGIPVPSKSIVSRYYSGDTIPLKPTKVDCFNWFYEDFNIQKFEKGKVYEQVFRIDSIGSAISVLWMA